MQAFIARHGQKTQAGSNKWQTVIYQRARQKSTQVNERGLRSANNIQRARQREIQVTNRRSGTSQQGTTKRLD